MKPPSTSARVVRPLFLPEPNWVTLKTAPPNFPFWFLCFFPVAVISFNVPFRVLMIVPAGIERSSVRGTKLPWSLIVTSPDTGATLNDAPSAGGAGGASAGVLNTTSGPNVVPSRVGRHQASVVQGVWHRPVTDASTEWTEKSVPTGSSVVDWSYTGPDVPGLV